MRIRNLVFTATLVGFSATAVRAQQPTTSAIRVQVSDTSGRPMAGAEVSVIKGLNESLGSGVTDAQGRISLQVTRSTDNYQLVVRRIGFQRADQFFRADRDSLPFTIALRRTIQELDAVTVTAQEDLKRKSYHIGADEIANTDRVMIDATDILAKLRPDMICGRFCRPLASVAAKVSNPMRACPGLVFLDRPKMSCPVSDEPPSLSTNVWVNGRRIKMVIPSEMALARQTGMLAGLSPGTMTVLSEIHPEHIAEITYIDSLDGSIGKIGSEGGLFIVLKQGIGYEPNRGSYVAPETAANANAPAPQQEVPEYRRRLLGVYDLDTGEPIADAHVIDAQTGTFARTTVTGTVSLVFLPEGGSPVRITKAGYEDLNIAVEISAERTTPLTLTMTKRPPAERRP